MKGQKNDHPSDHLPAVGAPATKPASPWWRQGGFFFLCLTAGTLLAYQPVWRADFIWDDGAYLTENTLVHRADGWWRVWSQKGFDYVPAAETTFWLEWHLWGKKPLGYHLDNLLLHILACALIWRILARLKIPGGWLAAAIFALHPVNVESAAWIAERKNTLAMPLYLGALWCYLKFEDSGKRRWYWSAAGAFLAALFSKTAVAPLPLVLLGLAWWRRGRIERKDVIRSLLFFALAAGGALLGIWIQKGGNEGGVRVASFGSRLAGAGWAFWFYLGKAIFPVHLVPVYPRWHIEAGRWVSYLPAVAAVSVCAAAWRYRERGGRAVVAALGYFLALLLPVLGFVDIGLMFLTPVADHWQYFAIIGPIALASVCLTQVLQTPRRGMMLARPAVYGLLLGALGILSWRQCRVFQSPTSQWEATLAADPNSFAGHGNLGGILFNSGKTAEAIGEYKKSIAIEPAYCDAHYDLGNIYLQTGRVSEAIAEYRTVLRLVPNHTLAINNLAWIMATCPQAPLRDGRRAVELAQRANQLARETNPSIYGTLAAAYAEGGRFSEALAAARRGVELAIAESNAAQVEDIRHQLRYYEKGSPYRDPMMAAPARPRK